MDKIENGIVCPNGIITVAQLTKAGLHRGYLHNFVESGELYRFGRGLYVQSSAWEDDFYLLQQKYSRGIYSHDTALYLLGYSDRTPAKYTMTFPKGYNALSLKQETRKPHKAINPKTLKLGDGVRVLSMNLNGTVSSLPDAQGNVFVQMGILRSKVNISDLELLQENSVSGPGLEARRKGSGSSNIKMSKSFGISPEINVLGMTVDDAVAQLDKYLDDAYIAHLPQVRIVHGKGTGALRAGIHKHLKRLKYIKEFHLGGFGEGDAGVTIVVFK